jgi:hypothetical protein
MPVLARLFPWSAGFLPRPRSATVLPPAPTSSPSVTAVWPSAPATGSAVAPPPANEASFVPVSLGERRAQALRSMFPLLFSLYARRSDLWHAIAVERYLAQARDLDDLEVRIAQVQRRRHFQWSE